jgi:hypothetical protein
VTIAQRRHHERRYHAHWRRLHGHSALARLADWRCCQRHAGRPGEISSAPRSLLDEALRDVAARLPLVAAREPTRRHRRHFSWLVGWYCRIAEALRSTEEEAA